MFDVLFLEVCRLLGLLMLVCLRLWSSFVSNSMLVFCNLWLFLNLKMFCLEMMSFVLVFLRIFCLINFVMCWWIVFSGRLRKCESVVCEIFCLMRLGLIVWMFENFLFIIGLFIILMIFVFRIVWIMRRFSGLNLL